jgi:glycosyltransferase involved in cell wall biosynthesis
MSLSSGQKVSIIIPCLNEELALPIILQKIPEFIDEVIIVDNGSTDKSVEVASRYPVKIVREELRGYGAAHLKGINSATGDILALLDADDTYSMKDLESILGLMEKDNLDFVSGCRFPLIDPAQTMPFINKIANAFISWLTTVLFGARIKDSQSGLMVFRRDFFSCLGVENKGMGFSQELKIRAWLAKDARCAEQHIHYGVRIGDSKFRKLPDGLKNFSSFLGLYFKVKRSV